MFVSFCVVVWVLFSVFSIFCITSLVSATPRNHQILLYLVKVRVWLRLSHSVKIGYINELVVKKETWILHTVLGPRLNMRKIAKLGVTPVVEAT